MGRLCSGRWDGSATCTVCVLGCLALRCLLALLGFGEISADFANMRIREYANVLILSWFPKLRFFPLPDTSTSIIERQSNASDSSVKRGWGWIGGVYGVQSNTRTYKMAEEHIPAAHSVHHACYFTLRSLCTIPALSGCATPAFSLEIHPRSFLGPLQQPLVLQPPLEWPIRTREYRTASKAWPHRSTRPKPL